MFDLSGQLALVTGGTRGIGQAMALALASAGSDLILLQRSSKDTETKDKAEAIGRRVTVYEADLLSNQSLRDSITRILHSDKHDVSILLNCAGIQIRHPSASFPMRTGPKYSKST